MSNALLRFFRGERRDCREGHISLGRPRPHALNLLSPLLFSRLVCISIRVNEHRSTDRRTGENSEQKPRNRRSFKRLIVLDLFRDTHFSVPILGKVIKPHYASNNKTYIPALLYLNTSHNSKQITFGFFSTSI